MKRTTVGRGGKRGKTSGRGGKGQSARAGNKRRPEWRDIIKRVPKLRGRGKNSNKGFQIKPLIVSLATLEATFNTKDVINPQALASKGLVSTKSGKIQAIKILGNDDITKAFTISGCAISDPAREKIVKAGGSVDASIPKAQVKEVRVVKAVVEQVKAVKKAAPNTKEAKPKKSEPAKVKTEKKVAAKK